MHFFAVRIFIAEQSFTTLGCRGLLHTRLCRRLRNFCIAIKNSRIFRCYSFRASRSQTAVNEIFRIARSTSWRCASQLNFFGHRPIFICLNMASECVFRTRIAGFLLTFIISHFSALVWSDDSFAERVLCVKRSAINSLSPFYRFSRRFFYCASLTLFGDHIYTCSW